MESAVSKVQKIFRYYRNIHFILYNGTIKSRGSIDIKSKFEQIISRNVDPYIKSIALIDSKLKDVAIFKRNTGLSGSSNPAYNGIRTIVTYKGKNHTVVLYKSGVVHFNGGYSSATTLHGRKIPIHQWYDIPQKVLSIVLGVTVPHGDIHMNNVSIQAQPITRKINLEKLLQYVSPNFKNAQYETNLGKYFLSFKNENIAFRIHANGIIQASNLTQPYDVNFVQQFIEDLTPVLKQASSGDISAVVYKNKKLKVMRTTCPPNKRPVPYTFEGVPKPNMFIAPNPQGLPCCYKIPAKITPTLIENVIKAFKTIGVKIPDSTKRSLGIMSNNVNVFKHKNIKSYQFVNRNGTLYIGLKGTTVRQGTRIPLEELRTIALLLGIMGVSKERSKLALLHKIANKAQVNKTVTNNRNLGVVGTGLNMRIITGKGQGQKVKDMSAAKIITLAKTHGYSLNASLSKSQLMQKLEAARNSRRKPASNSGSNINVNEFMRNLEKNNSNSGSNINVNEFMRNLEKNKSVSPLSSISNSSSPVRWSPNKKSPTLKKMARANTEIM